MSAISRDVYALKAKSAVLAGVDQTDVVNKETSTQSENPVLNLDTLGSQLAWPALPVREIETIVQPSMTLTGNSSGLQPTSSATETTGTCDVRNKSSGAQPPARSDKQWSVLASTPQGSNRFAVLASTDDDVNYDDRPFTASRSCVG